MMRTKALIHIFWFALWNHMWISMVNKKNVYMYPSKVEKSLKLCLYLIYNTQTEHIKKEEEETNNDTPTKWNEMKWIKIIRSK